MRQFEGTHLFLKPPINFLKALIAERTLLLPIQIRPVLSKIEPGSHSHLYDPWVLTHSPLKQASGPNSLHSSMSSQTKLRVFSCVPVGQMHWKLPGVFRHCPPLHTCTIDLTIHNGNISTEHRFKFNFTLRTFILFYYLPILRLRIRWCPCRFWGSRPPRIQDCRCTGMFRLSSHRHHSGIYWDSGHTH